MNRILFLAPHLNSRERQILQLLSARFETRVLSADQGLLSSNSYLPASVHLNPLPEARPSLQNRIWAPALPQFLGPAHPAIPKILREHSRLPIKPLLWFSTLELVRYLPLAKSLGFKSIVDTQRAEGNFSLENAVTSVWNWLKLPRAIHSAWFEGRYCMAADAVVTGSQIDASRIGRLAPRTPIHVIPPTVQAEDFQYMRNQPGRSLLFLGPLNRGSNIRGLHWFADEVLPRIKAALGTHVPPVVIAGRDPSKLFREKMEAAGIRVQANPSSPLPLLQESAAVFFPSHELDGIQTGILEAMAAGRAVVSTGKGAEGLPLAPGHDIWIADRTDGFAAAVIRLFRQPELREATSRNAVTTIEARYNAHCAQPLLDSLINSLSGYPSQE